MVTYQTYASILHHRTECRKQIQQYKQDFSLTSSAQCKFHPIYQQHIANILASPAPVAGTAGAGGTDTAVGVSNTSKGFAPARGDREDPRIIALAKHCYMPTDIVAGIVERSTGTL
uniref:Uncharacterized protein n=1 Tax=Lygus hesperus TaxID=30085 RepID=A0A146KWV5_LYGHE